MVQVSVVLYFTSNIDGLPVFPMFKVDSLARETLLKGKALYSWHPCTNLFRSEPFYIENIIYILTKQATLIRRSTVLSLPLQLVFPGRNISLLHLIARRGGGSTNSLRLCLILCLVFCNKDKTWKANGTATAHLLRIISNVLYFIG